MGYLYILLIFSFLVMIMPSLFKILIVVWLISLVINLFRPKGRPRTQENPFYQEPNNEETFQRKSNSDIIDVEFTQRDSKPDSE